MQNNAQLETLRPSGLPKHKARLIREWLVIFGENYRQEISPALGNIWEAHLGEVPDDDLKDAFQRGLLTCRFFPTLAEIRACLEKPQQERNALEEAKDTLDAEKGWEWLLKHIGEWGADRTPSFSGGKFTYSPELPAEVDYAVRQCGGYHFISTADENKMTFIRRDFIQHYRRHRETRGLLAPSRQEARALLKQVATWSLSLKETGE